MKINIHVYQQTPQQTQDPPLHPHLQFSLGNYGVRETPSANQPATPKTKLGPLPFLSPSAGPKSSPYKNLSPWLIHPYPTASLPWMRFSKKQLLLSFNSHLLKNFFTPIPSSLFFFKRSLILKVYSFLICHLIFPFQTTRPQSLFYCSISQPLDLASSSDHVKYVHTHVCLYTRITSAPVSKLERCLFLPSPYRCYWALVTLWYMHTLHYLRAETTGSVSLLMRVYEAMVMKPGAIQIKEK